jgi:hypothetical protein
LSRKLHCATGGLLLPVNDSSESSHSPNQPPCALQLEQQNLAPENYLEEGAKEARLFRTKSACSPNGLWGRLIAAPARLSSQGPTYRQNLMSAIFSPTLLLTSFGVTSIAAAASSSSAIFRVLAIEPCCAVRYARACRGMMVAGPFPRDAARTSTKKKHDVRSIEKVNNWSIGGG